MENAGASVDSGSGGTVAWNNPGNLLSGAAGTDTGHS